MSKENDEYNLISYDNLFMLFEHFINIIGGKCNLFI